MVEFPPTLIGIFLHDRKRISRRQSVVSICKIAIGCGDGNGRLPDKIAKNKK